MPEKDSKLFLSVIIPCYNEEKNLLEGKLEEVYRYLSPQHYTWEVIVVDDASTDSSRSILQTYIKSRKNFSLIDIPHGGKPSAIWAGIRQAEGENVLLIDMDQSTPIREFDNFLPWLRKGYEVIIGCRGNIRQGLSLVRTIGSHIFRALRRLVLLRHIRDTQCGFKACRRDTAVNIFPRLQYFRQTRKPTGWKVSAYDVELLFLFEKAGCRIKEIPVEWRDRDLSDTKRGVLIRYFNESVEMAREVMRVKWNQLSGKYPSELR
jgi:glycosyltransferase involved in cell wall biosynthesis